MGVVLYGGPGCRVEDVADALIARGMDFSFHWRMGRSGDLHYVSVPTSPHLVPVVITTFGSQVEDIVNAPINSDRNWKIYRMWRTRENAEKEIRVQAGRANQGEAWVQRELRVWDEVSAFDTHLSKATYHMGAWEPASVAENIREGVRRFLEDSSE